MTRNFVSNWCSVQESALPEISPATNEDIIAYHTLSHKLLKLQLY